MKKNDVQIQNKILWIAAAILFTLPASVHAQRLAEPNWPASRFASSPVSRAHEAFLKSDYLTMVKEMKQALLENSGDPLIRENMTDLMRKAYEAAGKTGLPNDWHLPSEITRLKFEVVRREKDKTSYFVRVQGNAATKSIIKQIQVIPNGSGAMLDKQAGIGEWSEEEEEDGGHYYELSGEHRNEPPSPGLYILKIDLVNGKHADGWFILDSASVATASPNVLAPAYEQTYPSGNPVFRWEDFHSPQYDPSERRGLWLGVSREEPPHYEWDQRWSYYQSPVNLFEVTAGKTEGGQGDSSLRDGRYSLHLVFSESRRFGDMVLSRDMSVVRPFFVSH